MSGRNGAQCRWNTDFGNRAEFDPFLPVRDGASIRLDLAQLASVGGSEEGPQVAVRFTLFGVTAQKLLL
jgi:hypothetical protein